MRIIFQSFLLLTILAAATLSGAAETGKSLSSNIPVKGMATLVDLGANTCISCKMMAPILDELQQEYKGRAAVIFINVRENRDQIGKFKVLAIPTQIFYNKQGQEVFRHMGFFAKESIRKKLDALIAE